MGCEGELSRAMTEELIDQWMQHFPLIYQTDSPPAMAVHCKLLGV